MEKMERVRKLEVPSQVQSFELGVLGMQLGAAFQAACAPCSMAQHLAAAQGRLSKDLLAAGIWVKHASLVVGDFAWVMLQIGRAHV